MALHGIGGEAIRVISIVIVGGTRSIDITKVVGRTRIVQKTP